ncbi:50S ribosomal protein L18 [Candidatus Cyrtobacter comes]|uniref:Large ribosomal subunit protein uL18 n=1 Tax=Candidatus Cyrtobacter comes TaxID=675776 RepID=A0ABU5L6J9_9RICK|nr:50S ribosomal protein L18 [Candidatus Cyrtobacter comes]MDZ5761738.1 50S ribosomal protein L18 [Candidatus Cyrtobacter comes]
MSKLANSIRRKNRTRHKLSSVSGDKCRLSVYKSNKHIYVQVIDDSKGVTLAAVSTLSKEFSGVVANASSAERLGDVIAKNAIAKGVNEVVFDRGGYKYHGCIKALADSARKAGLRF